MRGGRSYQRARRFVGALVMRRFGAWLWDKLMLASIAHREVMYRHYLTPEEYRVYRADQDRRGLLLPPGSLAETVSKTPRIYR